ncbi:MAG: HDIG domain-containing protein [Planctomycetes bacterium]|jgi:putative nucleotidyltransferase with HDIG domain|nr:HDIG domain-containing protein [Planctomycetota bacterium]
MDLGLNYEQAKSLLNQHITDKITKLHCRESEIIMQALARRFGENEDEWGIIGLLHDIDWEETKANPREHTVKAVTILSEAGATEELIKAVISHGYGNALCGHNQNKIRKSRLEHSLAAAETLTGLIVASALVQPDKKLSSVKPESLQKKYKTKAFAANCDREIIKEIEQTGLKLDEFFELSLKALQEISGELGL